MPEPIMRAEGLGKKFIIGHETRRKHHDTLRDSLASGVRAAFRRAARMAQGNGLIAGDVTEEFWAFRDVNFAVKRGEVMGIIGRNGAGKSTLLKVLSRIIEPSEGRVTIRGRVASLLEVGTGFHQELTGRENIFLNGAILGMSRAEIRSKFDEIVAFAEVEKFLDTPVKRYSSGMYVRLAFAVAAHLEPEILIIDEVLAVGDIAFQKKCLGKMSEVAHGGRTILFVSHDMGAVLRLCSRAMALDRGKVLAISDDVPWLIENYAAATRGSITSDWRNRGNEYASDYFVPQAMRVFPVARPVGDATAPQADFTLEIVGEVRSSDAALGIGIGVYSADGQLLFMSGIHDIENQRLPVGSVALRVGLPTDLFNEAEYEIELHVWLHGRAWVIPKGSGPRVRFSHLLHYASPYWGERRDGVIAPKLAWLVEAQTLREPMIARLGSR